MDGQTSPAKGDAATSSVSDLETESGPEHFINLLATVPSSGTDGDAFIPAAHSSPLTAVDSQTDELVDANSSSLSEGHSFSEHSKVSQGESSPQTDVTSHVSNVNVIDCQSQDDDCATQNGPLAGDHVGELETAKLCAQQIVANVMEHILHSLETSDDFSENNCMSASLSNPMPTADSVNTNPTLHDTINPSSSSSESASESDSDSSLSSNQNGNKNNVNKRKKKNNRKKINSNPPSTNGSPVAANKTSKKESPNCKADSSSPKTSPVEKPKLNVSAKVNTNLTKKPATSPKTVTDTKTPSPKGEHKCQAGQLEPKVNGVIANSSIEKPLNVSNGSVQSDALVSANSDQQTSNPPASKDKINSNESKIEDLPCELTNSKQSSESSLTSEATNQSMEDMDSKTKPVGGKAFGQNVPGESLCKICAKHVYHMEQIKAVKSVFHKACFRCNECNKQLNVDSYSSHEGSIYCKPHFKQLFQPKAVFENDESKQEPPARKYELIICENTPQELPDHVVRSSDKQEDVFENINLDLCNIRNRFENHANNDTNGFDTKKRNDKILTRSESIHKIMQKYQSRVAGDKDNASSSDDEENTKPTAEKEEKLAFSGMSALKSQWESGSINANSKSEKDRVEEELAELRQKHSEPLKQAYERAVQEAKSVENLAPKSDNYIVDSSVKAGSIKERFEKGNLESETEEDRIERLRKEREAEIQRLAGSDSCTKDARNKFKQIEANMGKEQEQVSNGTNGQTEDVSISSHDLQQRFQYFENLKDSQNAKENSHDVIDSKAEDIPKADTTKKMLDKFKALEAGQTDAQSNGVPKSPRRPTPPRETASVYENVPVAPRDANIVKSSYKTEEDIQVEPEKAKSLKAKFENWQTEIERENRKNNYEEEECVPHIDTTKNLRAMFESIKEELKPAEKPRPRVNRFVESKASGGEVCYVCSSRLYPMEKMEFSGIKIHKNCFRCNKCHAPLRLDNFTVTAEKLFCIPHFKQLFMEKGNYDEGFGLEQHKDKWSHKTAPATPALANGKSNGVEKSALENGNGLNGSAGNGHCDSDRLTDDHTTEDEEEHIVQQTDALELEDALEESEPNTDHLDDQELDGEVLDGPVAVDERLIETH